MSTILAKPGDKIVIIDQIHTKYCDKEWVVTEEPQAWHHLYDPDIVWLGPESGSDWPDPQTRISLYPHQYKFVDDVESIVDSLVGAKRRMDDNLRSVFG